MEPQADLGGLRLPEGKEELPFHRESGSLLVVLEQNITIFEKKQKHLQKHG